VAIRCALILWAISIQAFAQNPTATMVGTVRDATGAVVAGAPVEIRNIGTNETRAVHSGTNGEYTIPNLPAGRYETVVKQTGFRTLRVGNIELEIEQILRMDFKLEVGSVSESIEVTATASLLNTENAVKGDVMEAPEIGEML
jgi:hypothetical protein